MWRRLSSLFAAALTAVLAGCGTDKPSQFPSASQLSDIAARPVPPSVLPKESGQVTTWKLGAPPPDALATTPHQGDLPWDAPVLAFAAQRSASFYASESLHCIATETARVVAEQDVGPPAALRRFIATRCGAPIADYAYRTYGLRVPEATPDEQVLPKLVAKLPEMLAEVAKGGPRLGGAGFARGSRGAVVVVAAQERNVALEPTPTVPVDGKLVLRGQTLEPFDKLRAVVNRGSFGYAPCVVRADVRMPAFEVTCEVDPRDASAWVEVAGFLPGRILGRPVVEALVFPSGQPSDTFTAPAAADPTAITPANVVAALNARRREAGLGPVLMDGSESEVVDRVTPHYFAAASGLLEETLADRIVLGVQAGWAVRGRVELGQTASAITSSAGGAAGVVDAVLEHPIERSALFDPGVARVAVGIVRDPASQRVGVLVGAYTIVDERKGAERASALLSRLTQQRRARGLPAPES